MARWKRYTHGRVDYAPSQEAARRYPDIPLSEFQRAVQLIEPNGRRSSAAQAVFRALEYGGSPLWSRAYDHIPGFAPVSEFVYGIIAGHRPMFSTFTSWLWGNPGAPSSYRQARWLFLRALALIYGIAFWSFGHQIKGLIGSQGILPAHDFLEHLVSYGYARFWYVPTLAWVNSSDRFLVGLCGAGVVFSLLALFNIAPRLAFAALWALYLSLVSVGGDFMSFQWDALLLETGFLAIFYAPGGLFPQRQGSSSPSPVLLFLLRWLLFRLMFQSALVKWLSDDPLWHQFTALTVHYQTQPLPSPFSWYIHQMPVLFHKLSCMGMFLIEGLVPFLIFAPRRLRFFAFGSFAVLQLFIFITGNYTYFNLLAIVLCLPLLDDEVLRTLLPSWCDEPLAEERHKLRPWIATSLGGAILFLTTVPFLRVVGVRPWEWLMAPAVWTSPSRSFNNYGLFAVMTPERPEIILEGSNDGKTWLAYEFKYKPGDISVRPHQVAPDQPRLDWQMWFAALGDYRQNPWFMNLCVRMLQGAKPVMDLLKGNPFPGQPPRFLRAMLYVYRFTTPLERHQTGKWWDRTPRGIYCPVLSIREK